MYKGVHGCKQYLIQTDRLFKCWIQKRDTCQSESILSNQMSKLNDLCFNQRFQKFFKRERNRYPRTKEFDGPKNSTDRRNRRTEGLIWTSGYIQYIHASNSAWIFELLVFQTCLLRVHELGWISNLQDFKAFYSMFYFWAYEPSKWLSKSYPFVRTSSYVHTILTTGFFWSSVYTVGP